MEVRLCCMKPMRQQPHTAFVPLLLPPQQPDRQATHSMQAGRVPPSPALSEHLQFLLLLLLVCCWCHCCQHCLCLSGGTLMARHPTINIANALSRLASSTNS
jgi:hypothetical protein